MIVVSVCGATCTGKTDLAFQIAQEFRTEIISFDSLQVYKFLDIGTAKPPKAMLAEIKHHFINCLEPNQEFTAGDFRKTALEILSSLAKHKDVCVLVGGTGFYLQALIRGMYDVPSVSPEIKKGLKDELEKEGLERLYEQVKAADPVYAQTIHSNDAYRILRGLELIRSGRGPSEIKKEFQARTVKFPYELIQIGLRRKKEALRHAIERRSQAMVDEGLIQETRSIMARFGPVRPLESVGYKETLGYLRGELTKEELVRDITKSTMALAKRQSTWFKRDERIVWTDTDEENALVKTLDLIKKL